MTKEELREKANDLPLAPGVYLMMDKTGRVIYVGKAKKLKNRVSQYFQDSASHTAKTRNMVSQVDRFDTIFVTSEFEALVLENSITTRRQLDTLILLLVLAGCLVLFGGMELLSRGGDPAGEITAAMFLGWLGLLGTIGALASLLSRAIKVRYLKSQEQEEKIQL